jgi:trehalose monomycolate/heme transporter
MFAWWGSRVARWRRWVLAGGIVFVLLGGLWGTGVFSALGNGGFDDKGSENQKAQALLDKRVGNTNADVVVLFRNPGVTVDDPAYRHTVDTAMAKFPPGLAVAANTYWTTHSPDFVSADRHSTFAAVSLKNRDDTIAMSKYDAMRDAVKGTGYTVQVGGQSGLSSDLNEQVKKSIAHAEMLSAPVLLVLLTIVFGSIAAATLPLAVGVMAIMGSFISLRVISMATDVSVFG